tara:strand:+ start:138 stop:731 length:594 start_codon:yes stop_codon:yes gene_type:complete
MPDIEDLEKTVDRELKKLKTWEEKTLQVVNLAPSEIWVEKITEVHPMKQIFWASIIQACVFGFMLLSFLLISVGLKANDFDFEQMKEDEERIKASEYTYNFDFQNPRHKYFLVINALDVASTMYALENRNTLYEGNPILPKKPELEELILQKAIIAYTLNYIGIFSTNPDEEWYLNAMNIAITGAVINNLDKINKYD